jgi:hypothetical protein
LPSASHQEFICPVVVRTIRKGGGGKSLIELFVQSEHLSKQEELTLFLNADLKLPIFESRNSRATNRLIRFELFGIENSARRRIASVPSLRRTF